MRFRCGCVDSLRMVLFTWPGRGRLELRWTRAASNPRRVTVPIEEQVRQHQLTEVYDGRMTPEEAEERYERFLTRRRRGLSDAP